MTSSLMSLMPSAHTSKTTTAAIPHTHIAYSLRHFYGATMTFNGYYQLRVLMQNLAKNDLVQPWQNASESTYLSQVYSVKKIYGGLCP